MPRVTKRIAIASALILGGLSLSGCATKAYVNEQIAGVNTRVDAVDAKASDALARADAAAADARTANQRLDQLTSRVDVIEQNAATMRRPRN